MVVGQVFENLQESLDRFLMDHESKKTIRDHVIKSRKEFGDGYLLLDFSEVDTLGGVGVYWLDETSGQKIFDPSAAPQIWAIASKSMKNCPKGSVVVIGIICEQNPDPTKSTSELILTVVDITDKPSSITSQQIKKRLKRMVDTGCRLLTLDTSHPDFMGKNLAKWLYALKDLEQQGKHISVIIDSSPDYPSDIPASLQSSVLSVSL